MIQSSEKIDQLATSLVAAQSEFPVIAKSHTGLIKGMGKNGAYEYAYHYADLADTVAAVKEILEKYGLAITQFPDFDGTNELLTTRLMHTSGQWLEASARLLTQQTAQGQGSALSYARRYGFCAVLGIVADEDDDAQVATNAVPETTGTNSPPPLPNIDGATTTQETAITTRRESPVARPTPVGDKTYLFVPFDDKDAVKALGGRWDKDAPDPSRPGKLGRWYVPSGVDPTPLQRWIPVDEPV